MAISTETGTHDFTMASRKAEEAAWRRFQAVQWLESLVGPLGIPSRPSEREFISCLRNGLILCNAINKIHPGAVPKVVEIQLPLQSLSREMQPLPAYQYFENVRNFLLAVEELKLPAFEASDLERESLETGSVSKVVDCVLSLKSYHEWKQISSANGLNRHSKSPLVIHSANRVQSRTPSGVTLADSCRRLDMSVSSQKQPPPPHSERDSKKLEETIAKMLVELMFGLKENIDENLLASFHNGDSDRIEIFRNLISGNSSLGEQLQNKCPEFHSALKDSLKVRNISQTNSKSKPLEELSALQNVKLCKSCLRKGNCSCHHKELFAMQERELLDLKALLLRTKQEFENLQVNLNSDLKDLGAKVQELSSAALGYHKVVKENRSLYNLVQDLKGNIRVYCRIRPSFISEAGSVIDFVGDDGSLVLSDPSKPVQEGRRVFNFNRVFGPTSTQDEIFEDTQPLIRSVMDGYNVCIFAYGQTGSGKTYTMSGPSGGSARERGINYLALHDLFQISNQRKDIVTYEIHAQMVEIYNEQVRDLLADDSSATRLEIRSCPSENGLTLPDAMMRPVKSTEDVINLIKLGEINRFVSSTAMNARSSRSHSVLTVHVHGRETSGDDIRSCLHLVDLAGSERVDKSEATGDRLKEAQCINKSLSCLGDVITALAQKNSHIPYRNSKLTLLLQDSLGGHAKTLMFAHVSPEDDSFSETISTLKFAQRASTVELGAARSHKESNEVIQLKQQVENLKKTLANKEARAVIERTPPRLRRLSIEPVKSERETNPEERKGSKTPTLPHRSRRSSLEGPTSLKREINVSDNIRKPKSVLIEKFSQSRDFEAATKPFGNLGDGTQIPSFSVQVPKDPRSPTSASHQKRAKTDSRSQIPSLQQPKTPESQIRFRNEAQIIMQNELTFSIDCQTPSIVTSSANNVKASSHIKKSLRSTIGKLINGSEKRNQQNFSEVKTTTKIGYSVDNAKSPVKTNNNNNNARTLRRQSLTGISESNKNRRSSLGGKSENNNNVKDNRNSKTPPPVRQSATNLAHRWV